MDILKPIEVSVLLILGCCVLLTVIFWLEYPFDIPLLTDIALTVAVEERLKEPVYFLLEVLGAEPLVV